MLFYKSERSVHAVDSLCAVHVNFFLLSILCGGIVGTGEVRPVEIKSSEVSERWRMLCDSSLAGCDVAHVCR